MGAYKVFKIIIARSTKINGSAEGGPVFYVCYIRKNRISVKGLFEFRQKLIFLTH